MKKLIQFLALLSLAIGFAFASAPARADTLTFPIRSSYDYTLRLEFYSPSRNVYWPGNNKSWALDDYDSHNYKLNCRRGEKVCYGAWEPGGTLQWGVGYHYSQTCTTCCYTCKGNTSTKPINLTPN